MKTIAEELKELERLEQQLADKRAKLEEQAKAEAELSQWYDGVLSESGHTQPRELIKSMMRHFGLRTVSLAGVRSEGSQGSQTSGKRHRTKMTAGLRDAIKSELAGGAKKSQIIRQHNVSFAVVKKVLAGEYDSL